MTAYREGATPTQLSVFANRTLVTGIDGGAGFAISNQASFGLTDVNAFGFTTAYAPATGIELQRTTSIDPGLGDCAVMIPESSPMKRAAADGGDIGANLLYRYHDGGLTSEPLWSPGFPCGAIVPGVNDVPGASCFDLHLRLGNGACNFPAGYLPGSSLDGGSATDGGPADPQKGTEPWKLTVGCGCQSDGVPHALAVFGVLGLLARRAGPRRRALLLGQPMVR